MNIFRRITSGSKSSAPSSASPNLSDADMKFEKLRQMRIERESRPAQRDLRCCANCAYWVIDSYIGKKWLEGDPVEFFGVLGWGNENGLKSWCVRRAPMIIKGIEMPRTEHPITDRMHVCGDFERRTPENIIPDLRKGKENKKSES